MGLYGWGQIRRVSKALTIMNLSIQSVIKEYFTYNVAIATRADFRVNLGIHRRAFLTVAENSERATPFDVGVKEQISFPETL